MCFYSNHDKWNLNYLETFASIVAGVSCDSCMKANFKGKRYKCLICYDYDLCSTCYEGGVTTGRHSTDHAMQCILTRADFGGHFIFICICFSLICLCIHI